MNMMCIVLRRVDRYNPARVHALLVTSLVDVDFGIPQGIYKGLLANINL